MTTALLPSEAIIENKSLNPEASEEALIAAAKSLNETIKGHLRRSAEDFWRMGEALAYLYQRRHPKGRWADILDEIGISTKTDNHARRLYRDTTLEGLAEYRNRTAALRALGILSTPAPKQPQGSTPEVEDRKEQPDSIPGHSVKPRPAFVDRKSRSVKQREVNEVGAKVVRLPPVSAHPSGHAPGDSLKVLAMVAARLEDLAETEIDVTPDHLVQIDLMLRAIEVIRSNGGAHVAA